MATFYYPNRGAPTKTVAIAKLEAFPSSRPRNLQQSRDETPGGQAIVYSLGSPIQLLSINIKVISAANKVALVDFIDNYADGAVNSFDFTDGQLNEYNGCRFWFDDYDFRQFSYGYFEDELLLRVDP